MILTQFVHQDAPFYVKKYGRLELPIVTEIDRHGFYVPNNPHLEHSEIEYICETINSLMV